MILCDPWIQCLPLILLQLLNKCVLHLISCTDMLAQTTWDTYLCQERWVELIPFWSLEICLLQHSCLSKDIDLGSNMQIPACQLRCIPLISWVKLLDVVLCVLDYDFVGVTIESKDDHDQVLFAILDPPTSELQTLYVIYSRKRDICKLHIHNDQNSLAYTSC